MTGQTDIDNYISPQRLFTHNIKITEALWNTSKG